MDFLEKIKLDRWFGIVLYLGVGLLGITFFTKPEFVEKKHLLGLGLGCILIGISYFIAEKHLTEFIRGGMLKTKILQHNFISYLILILGIGMVGYFGFLLIKTLI